MKIWRKGASAVREAHRSRTVLQADRHHDARTYARRLAFAIQIGRFCELARGPWANSCSSPQVNYLWRHDAHALGIRR